jgi:hypothetical protein
MNFISYRYNLSKLKCKKKYSERCILKDIAEARENKNSEQLEKLLSLLNANNIRYKKNKHKLVTSYFLLQH